MFKKFEDIHNIVRDRFKASLVNVMKNTEIRKFHYISENYVNFH